MYLCMFLALTSQVVTQLLSLGIQGWSWCRQTAPISSSCLFSPGHQSLFLLSPKGQLTNGDETQHFLSLSPSEIDVWATKREPKSENHLWNADANPFFTCYRVLNHFRETKYVSLLYTGALFFPSVSLLFQARRGKCFWHFHLCLSFHVLIFYPLII